MRYFPVAYCAPDPYDPLDRLTFSFGEVKGSRLLAGAILLPLAATVLPFAAVALGNAIGPRLGPGIDAETAKVVSRRARFGAMLLNRGLARLVYPAALTTRVWRDPGHCGRAYHEANDGGPLTDYRATVVQLTWFAIPAGKVHSTCGGDSWSRVTA
ncbi:MAG: hypothetical protein H0W30_05420 [Gemmatimonadaceae bacterium]|nr:hypothetical protein [Gemmatimonadaceae bacterium]MBA3558022.1 hypothetical protein [Gemmatimonadaceae bacterium]